MPRNGGRSLDRRARSAAAIAAAGALSCLALAAPAQAQAQQAPAPQVLVTHRVTLLNNGESAHLSWVLSTPDFLPPSVNLRCTVRARGASLTILQARSSAGDDLRIGRRVIRPEAVKAIMAAAAASDQVGLPPDDATNLVRCQASKIVAAPNRRSPARLLAMQTIDPDVTSRTPAQVKATVRVARFEDQQWPGRPVVMCAFMDGHRLSSVEIATVPPMEAGKRADLTMTVSERPGEWVTGLQCGQAVEDPRPR